MGQGQNNLWKVYSKAEPLGISYEIGPYPQAVGLQPSRNVSIYDEGHFPSAEIKERAELVAKAVNKYVMDRYTHEHGLKLGMVLYRKEILE